MRCWFRTNPCRARMAEVCTERVVPEPDPMSESSEGDNGIRFVTRCVTIDMPLTVYITCYSRSSPASIRRSRALHSSSCSSHNILTVLIALCRSGPLLDPSIASYKSLKRRDAVSDSAATSLHSCCSVLRTIFSFSGETYVTAPCLITSSLRACEAARW